MISRPTLLRWTDFCTPEQSLHVATVVAKRRPPRPEHCHDFFECFLVEQGAGVQQINGADHQLTTGQLWFLRPEHPHTLRAIDEAGFRFTNVALLPTVVERVAPLHEASQGAWRPDASPMPLTLSPSQQSQFLALAADAGSGPRDAIDAAWFALALMRLLRTAEARSGLPTWMNEAIEYAREPDNLRLGLPRLQQLCGRSPEHVSRSFRRLLGVTPSEWIARERVAQAQRLLHGSQKSVLEVAMECGFRTTGHFHDCFKRLVGTTPLKYRQRCSAIQQVQ